MVDIARDVSKTFGNEIEINYIDILSGPVIPAYQEVVGEAYIGATDLPVVFIDGERRLAGALTADLLKAELIAMGISPKEVADGNA